jgi:hypothetical protein
MKGNALAALSLSLLLAVWSSGAAFGNGTACLPSDAAKISSAALQRDAQGQGAPESKPNAAGTSCPTCQGAPEPRPPEKPKGNPVKKRGKSGNAS